MIDEARARWHLLVPVCRTKRGLRTHLGIISCQDLKLLCRYLNCSVNDLVDKAWACSKGLRGKA